MVEQKLPNNWEEREVLRNKGQFWTPTWVAKAMVEYVIDNSSLLFDPATGNGAFYDALKESRKRANNDIRFYGTDIDEQVMKEGLAQGIYDLENCRLEVRDFIINSPLKKFKSIIANPPYIRHHRLDISLKNKLKELSQNIMGFTIDARAGLHVFFLIQALSLLDIHGKLAFIMPADTAEGVFAPTLWAWITKKYCLECVVSFLPEASPFPKVDTNALIFLIKNDKPRDYIYWAISKKANSDDLERFIESKLKKSSFKSLDIHKRTLQEALATGLSRSPQIGQKTKYILSDFAKVMRGIATGANEYFYLTKKRASELGLPQDCFKVAIGRTRDVEGDVINAETIKKMEDRDKPTLLLSLDERNLREYPDSVREYIKLGEEMGLPERALIQTRKPWFKMEKRKVPAFFFAYLGRRKARFILNEARVLPLTGFLCVYPKAEDEKYVNELREILTHPKTINNLKLVAKSYGNGALKVEPRALERLPIPADIVKRIGIKPIRDTLF